MQCNESDFIFVGVTYLSPYVPIFFLLNWEKSCSFMKFPILIFPQNNSLPQYRKLYRQDEFTNWQNYRTTNQHKCIIINHFYIVTFP